MLRAEYPRPNFVRSAWQSLNGAWDFTYGETNTTIQVPFVCQSEKSGVGVRITQDDIVYQRQFTMPATWSDDTILLHFGAVDYAAQIFLNGHCLGQHIGGQTPFSFDITSFLVEGEQTLTVKVHDPLSDESIPRGKQFWENPARFIWYTPSSGIWQSVWLEPIKKAALDVTQLRFTPDIDAGTITIDWALQAGCPLPCTLQIEIALGESLVFSGIQTCLAQRGSLCVNVFGNKALAGAFHFTGCYWSPESPTLYDITLRVLHEGAEQDCVRSYFGMRKIEIKEGKIYLNHRPCYQKLLLDQGYWKEGLITAPSTEAYRDDILKMKAMGFNGCRKHEKVEDPQFLYWADKLGFLVWEGMASAWVYSPQTATAFTREWQEVIARDYNHPCIIAWGMLNESWGVPSIYDDPTQQHYADSLYYMAKSLDATRIVVGNDGWEQTCSDICALHSYQHGAQGDLAAQKRFANALQHPEQMAQIVEKLPYAKGYTRTTQPYLLSECGGISVISDTIDAVQATQDGQAWGYTSASTQEFLEVYRRLIETIRDAEDFCGFCYTQLTDIEQEVNGLLTETHDYKFNPDALCEINNF